MCHYRVTIYERFQHNMMKAEILLHTTLAHGDIQAVDTKTQTDIKLPDYLKNFLKLALLQVI